MYRILVVEDEDDIQKILENYSGSVEADLLILCCWML